MSYHHGDTVQGIVYDMWFEIYLPNDGSTTIETCQNKYNI
jgi:hypothetical protein